MRPAVDTRSLRTRRFGAPLPAPEPELKAAGSTQAVGPWRLVQQLTSGDFLAIYQAQPLAAAGIAADYLLKLPIAGEAWANLCPALLAREKAVARSLHHRHVVSVLSGRLSHTPPYLILAAAGTPLDCWPGERLPLRVALWRTRQMAAALAALHAAGWIHSRLTPEALLISRTGQVTLHELGWARRIGTAECRTDQLLAADLRYVAPEMLSQASVLSAAADVYGLGVLLIELLTGLPAVSANDPQQAALAHLRGELTDVCRWRPKLPGSLLRLVRRMTSREPLRRPSALEVQHHLVRLEVNCLGCGKTGPQIA